MRRILLAALAVVCLFPIAVHAQEFVEAAAEGDLVKMMELFSADSSLITETNAFGKTAVHFAAQNNNMEMLRWLHGQGADIDAPNTAKQTPLLYAVYFGHEDAVKFLLEVGADVLTADEYGDTLLDLAVLEEHDAVAALLRDRGAVESVIGQPQLVPLAPHIHRLAFPYYMNPNICLQTGSDGILLVDTGWKRTAQQLVDQVRILAGGEVDLVINTHSHPDHSGGNEIFARAGVPIIGLETLAEAEARGLIEKGEGVLRGEAGGSFETWYRMHYNDEIIHLIPYPDIHTEHDMLVHFTGAKVVHIGDLLIGQSFPSVRKDVDRYVEFLEIVEGFFAPDVTLVCGHGREMTTADVVRYREMVTEVRDLVLEKLAAGQDIDTIKACDEMGRYADYGVFIPILSSDWWVDAIGRQQVGD